MTTVLICDDQGQVRDLLSRQVASVPGVERVQTAMCGEEVLTRWDELRPDLVLMDVRMPGIGGIEATRRLLAAHPEATVVMLAAAADRDSVALAVSGGARGYLAKGAGHEELCAALAGALASASARVARPLPAPRPAEPDPPALTERELQVLHGMAQGLSNAQIGRRLFLSEDTVKTHARRLFRKMHAADRAQAVALGFRWGLVR